MAVSFFFRFGGASYTDDISDSFPASTLASFSFFDLDSPDYTISCDLRYLCYVHTTLSLSFGLLPDSGLFLDFDSGLAFFTSLSGFDFDFD